MGKPTIVIFTPDALNTCYMIITIQFDYQQLLRLLKITAIKQSSFVSDFESKESKRLFWMLSLSEKNNHSSPEHRGLAQTCCSITIPQCKMWGSKKQRFSGLVSRKWSELHRALNLTPLNTFKMNYRNDSMPNLLTSPLVTDQAHTQWLLSLIIIVYN